MHDRSESRALRLLGHLPVAHAPELVALFGLFAEVERDLISERTREGLASARAKGRLLGRPKGVLGKSRLDGKEEEIRVLLQKQVSKASIAKIVGVTRPTIYRFIKTRRLRPHP